MGEKDFTILKGKQTFAGGIFRSACMWAWFLVNSDLFSLFECRDSCKKNFYEKNLCTRKITFLCNVFFMYSLHTAFFTFFDLAFEYVIYLSNGNNEFIGEPNNTMELAFKTTMEMILWHSFFCDFI